MILYFFTGAAAEFYGHTPETVSVGDGALFTGDLGKVPARRTGSGYPDAPPHVALANVSPEPKSIVAFTKRYGPVSPPTSVFARGHSQARDPGRASDAAVALTPDNLLSLGSDDDVRETFSFTLNEFAERQTRLRLAWREERTAIAELRQGVRVANFQVSLYGASGGENKVLLRTRLLWDYISLIFLIDYDSARAKVCANRECETPYFLQQRTDKEFCSHKCAVTVNNMRRAEQKRKARDK
jgi:hypothetical protein